jgi:hypothetical protein
MSAKSVIGIWGAASRQKATLRHHEDDYRSVGPFMQVSRLGNPLFNEVIVPMGDKDRWNALDPHDDGQFAKYVARPERADLLALLLTGIPAGIVPGFQNFTGPTQADMLRLNMAIPPSNSPNPLGLIGGDAAGFPNGRRLADDVVTVELRAIAGATYSLVQPSYVPDAAVGAIQDGTFGNPGRVLLPAFPYVGYDVPA